MFFFNKGERFLDVDSGRADNFSGEPSQHFTFVFNVFVMMTLFNEINARKIDGSPNVFEKLHKSHLFLIIWTLSFALQVSC
jgi:P-type Ca2+ transporter type 2B